MYAFTRTALCVLAVVALCVGTANAAITVVHQYNLGENDVGTIGNTGLDPTVDSVGGLNLTRYGSPTNVAGCGQLGSTMGMDFLNYTGGAHGTSPATKATQYYHGSASGVLASTNNFGVDFWFKIDAVPTSGDKDQTIVHVGGSGQNYTGGSNYGIAFQTYTDSGVTKINVTDWAGMGARVNYALSTDTWYHLVYITKTPKGTGIDDNDAHVYINDTEYGYTNVSHGLPYIWTGANTPVSLPNKFTVGAMMFYGYNPEGFYRGFDGAVDSLRFFTFQEGQFQISDTTNPIPEPGTLVLLAAGLLGVLVYAWRKRK